MKNALKRLQGRIRARWYLHQARTTIARCNRSLARRRRIGVPLPAEPQPRVPYFAPGIITAPGRRAGLGLRPYAITVAIAIASAVVYLVRAA